MKDKELLTVGEIRKIRKECNEDILKACMSFEDATGLKITAVFYYPGDEASYGRVDLNHENI